MGLLKVKVIDARSIDAIARKAETNRRLLQNVSKIVNNSVPFHRNQANSMKGLANRLGLLGRQVTLNARNIEANKRAGQAVERSLRGNWIERARDFFGSTYQRVTQFFSNTASSIDNILSRVPGWNWLKRASSKGLQLLNAFMSNPITQRILGLFGLVANVFSVFSSFAQWKSLFDVQRQFNSFSDNVLKTQTRDFERLLRLITNERANSAKLARELNAITPRVDRAIGENIAQNRFINELRNSNANLTDQLRSQKSAIDGVTRGVAQAATAQAINLAIGQVVSRYQLAQVPTLVRGQNAIPNGFANRLTGVEKGLETLRRQPGPAGPAGKNGIDGRNGINGVNGLPGPQGLRGPAGINGVNGTNGRNGTDGRNGTNGLTTIITRREEVPVTVVQTVVVEKIDPTVKAEILATKAIATTTNNNVVAQTGILTGIVNTVNSIQQYSLKIGNHLGLSRVFAVLNLWCNLTILASTTSNIFSLLGSGLDSALSLFGFAIQGPDGEAIGASQVVRNTAINMIKSVIGADNFNEGVIQLANLSRINTALTSAYMNIASMVDPIRYGVGEIYERVSRSRNEKIDAGLIDERSRWDESASAMMNKNPLGRLNDATQSVENSVSMITSTIDTAVSIGDSYRQLQADRTNLKQAANDLAAGKNQEAQERLQNSQVPATLDNFQLGKKES